MYFPTSRIILTWYFLKSFGDLIPFTKQTIALTGYSPNRFELSKAIGKDHVMVMGIVDEGLKNAFLKEVEREVSYEG